MTQAGSGRAGPMVAIAVALAIPAGPADAQAARDTATAPAPRDATAPRDALAKGFADPPQQSRPRVWWHWMGGQVTAEGAALDLAWMQRIGIGGVHVFSGDLLTPKVVKEPMPFMSPRWQDVFRRSLATARTAGMEVAIAGSPGWSQTGGPWVPPADAMKKYVWSETRVRGGRRAGPIRLPRPPAVAGPFQGAALPPSPLGPRAAAPVVYADSFVIAFPTPAVERDDAAPRFTASAGAIDPSAILSGDLSTGVDVAVTPGTTTAWVQAAYPRPTTIRALTLGLGDPAGAGFELQASDDGRSFRTVIAVPTRNLNTIDFPAPQQTYAFAPTRARLFRLLLLAPPPVEPLPGMPSRFPRAKPATRFTLTKLSFETGTRLDRFEAKAGFEPSVGDVAAAADAGGPALARTGVIDLTGRLRADGTLDWTPPRGDWTVLRFGWSLTGHRNGPAEPEATGLEVDKLDPAAVERYLDAYLALYDRASGGRLGAAGISHLLTDSWEAGVQNWTPGLPDAFRARRGYDLTAFLPVLAGRIVGDTATSERFLYDFRRTLEEMVADHHHGTIARALHARGMAYYSEAQGDAPRAIADGMTLKARADVPTAEYWYRPFAAGPGQPPLKADLEEAASAAHVYGRRHAAAEALTVAAGDDPWSFSPAMLKPVADEIFVRGINRILLHESHLQPVVEGKPGLSMFIFGQFFNRNETWAEDAKPWIDYLARTSFMLEQGRYVADVAYFYGEDRNLTELFRTRVNTDVPPGYRYDYINPEALLSLLSVRDGRIVTPSGMEYRLLFMPPHVTRYTLPALSKLRELVAAGAVVVAPRPVGGLGIAASDDQVRLLADQIWGSGTADMHRLGHGRVYAAMPLGDVLAREGVAPDIALAGLPGDAAVPALHRRTDDADIYFLSNQRARAERFEASFRVRGRVPELWHADTGRIADAGYRVEGDRVRVPMRLAAHEAVFVVFRKPADRPAWSPPEPRETTLATLAGPWQVRFEDGRGAPATARFDTLTSWAEHQEPGIRHYSGAATYRRTVTASPQWLGGGRRVLLDLGDVRELAAVRVNGRAVGTAWHAPYRLDVTGALKPGANSVEIRVVNLWPNRLIGDKQPGATPAAFAPQSPYTASSPLLPSGLLGPVRLLGLDEAR